MDTFAALSHDMPFVGLPIFSEKVYHFCSGRKDFLPVEPQSGLSFLKLFLVMFDLYRTMDRSNLKVNRGFLPRQAEARSGRTD